MKNLITITALLLFMTLHTSCDNDSKAQESSFEFKSVFSGSFVVGPVSTDTNDDGRPSTLLNYLGESNFGSISMNLIAEFAQPIPPLNCPETNLEFDLVLGNFVFRVENGDLLMGQWDFGKSCFDSEMLISVVTLNGRITGGTGQFTNAEGSIELSSDQEFLTTTAENGFQSGGSSGTLNGTINFINGGN